MSTSGPGSGSGFGQDRKNLLSQVFWSRSTDSPEEYVNDVIFSQPIRGSG